MSEDKKTVSRREFLRIGGIAGAAVAAGGGMGGLLAACGGEETTTTTRAASGATVTTGAAVATTVGVGVEMGREIKIGYAHPVTGPLGAYGIPDDYVMARAKEGYGEGIIGADGRRHPITIIARDTQSDTNRASQIAGDLINNDRVDLIMCAGTADTVAPVADQAEANGVPCLSTDCPFENFVGGRAQGDMTKTFEWTYNAGWTVGDVVVAWVDYWNQVPSNKRMGVILGNNALGAIWLDLWSKILPAQGFQGTFTDLYPPGAEDYTQIITRLKRDGCELGLGLFTPPDFSNFWAQSLQQGWRPVALIVGIALNFPSAAVSLGDRVLNLGGSHAWNPVFPFASPLLNGETCAEFAADYEEKTGTQWSHPLQHLLLFEWAADIFSRTTDLDDKAATLAAVRTTKMDTINGPLDFTEPISQKLGSSLNHPNNYKLPVVADQWRKGVGKWPYDKVIVSNAAAPNVPTQDGVRPIVYAS